MKKISQFIGLLAIALLFNSHETKAQGNQIILEKTLLTDLSKTPIYPKLSHLENGISVFKPEYAYLDSINIFSITYLSDGLKVKGLLVSPKNGENLPCIVFNRGGNREFGSLKIAHAALFMGPLAKEGYVVIASQYRGVAGGEGKEEFGGAELNDVLVLNEALKEIEQADPTRIGLYGWSRGGMMTYQALRASKSYKAAIVGGGVSDHWALIKDRPEIESNVLMELVPNYKANRAAELDNRSAIKWANEFPDNTPILLLHGNSDWRVKAEQSMRLALALDQFRKPYRLVVFEGADHGIKEFKTEVLQMSIQWFNRYLKTNSNSINMDFHGN